MQIDGLRVSRFVINASYPFTSCRSSSRLLFAPTGEQEMKNVLLLVGNQCGGLL